MISKMTMMTSLMMISSRMKKMRLRIRQRKSQRLKKKNNFTIFMGAAFM